MNFLDQAGHREPAQDQGPKLEPLYFGAVGELFGCLHCPRGSPRAGSGVVICPAAGPEYADCGRPLRVLAALLARNGWPVLRFDYFATGDSYGDGEEATLSRWQDDVADAVRFLRGRFRATHLTLLGVRIGAALAVRHVLARGGIERLVLWDPVVRGREFVDGLRAQTADHERWLVRRHGQRPASIEPDGPQDLFGYRYSDVMLDALASLDLMTESGRGWAEIPILDNGEDAAMDGLAERLRAAGMQAHLQRLPDKTVLDHRALPGAVIDPEPQAPRRLDIRVMSGFAEQPALIGAAPPLVSVTTHPSGHPRSTAVIIPGAGLVHRVVPNRMTVRAARSLAGYSADWETYEFVRGEARNYLTIMG